LLKMKILQSFVKINQLKDMLKWEKD